jgi:hypothetical protein
VKLRIWVEFAANGGVIEDISPAQDAELLTIGNITTSQDKYWEVWGNSKFADIDYFEREILAVYFEKPENYGEWLVFHGEGGNTKPHPRYSSVIVPDDFVVPPDLLPFGERLIDEALDSLEDALRARGLSRTADLVEQSRNAASLREVIKEQVTAHTELLDEALNGGEAFNEAEYEAASRASVRKFLNDLGDELGDGSIPLALGDGLTSQVGWGSRGDEPLRVVLYDAPFVQLWGELDAAVGGSGNDTIYADSDSGQTVVGAAGNDTIKDDLFDHAADRLYGGSGDDSIESLQGYDLLYGGPGNDELRGGWGGHTVDGGSGNDIIVSRDGAEDDLPDMLAGGSGDDRIRLGAYSDQIFGGSGRDRFVIGEEYAFVDTGGLPAGVQAFEGALIWDLEAGDVIEVEGRRLDRPARYVESQATGAGIELVVDGQAVMLNTC